MLKIIKKPEDLYYRRGKFRISLGFLRQSTDTVMALMSKFIVIRAEMLFGEDAIDYTALSPLFDMVEEGHTIPEYRLDIETENAQISGWHKHEVEVTMTVNVTATKVE